MKAWVLDTSALLRLYVPDGPLPEGLEAAVGAAQNGEAVLLIPELALAEAAQVLWKKEYKGLLRPAETDEILGELLALPLEVIGHGEFLPAALQLARKFSITVYDALFPALAQARGAGLLTADEKLQKVWRRLQPE